MEMTSSHGGVSTFLLHPTHNQINPLFHSADPHLTPLGEQQSHHIHSLWAAEVADGLPLPDVWYCSPMRRAASTLMMSFGSLRPPLQKPIFLEVRAPISMN